MYYYIMEQPKNRTTLKFQENIRKTLGNIGIMGETVTVSPARTTEELVDIGLNKNYSTIVAVGSDRHINKIASFIKNKNCALGIIPINCSILIYQLIGTSDVKEACEILKYRRLKVINMGAIEPNKYFITQAEIHFPHSTNVTITIINPGYDSYKAEMPVSEIIISRNLYLLTTDKTNSQNPISSFWSWLTNKKTPDNQSSILRGKKIKIETPEPMPIYLDGEIIAKTSAVATLYPKALKIIGKPDRIKEEQERKNEETKNQ